MQLSALVSAASVAYDRLSELPAIAALLLLAAWSFSFRTIAFFAAALFVLVGAGALLRRATTLRPAWVEHFRGVRIAPSALAAAIGLSIVLWSLDVVRLRLVAATMRAPIGLAQAAALSAVTIAAGWAPTIGGLGAIEGGLLAGLIAFGVAPVDAAAVTAIERAISYGAATLAGAAAMAVLGIGRTERAALRSSPVI
jgi:uncharacterized membrane protein YbhN (UPF0104 family)